MISVSGRGFAAVRKRIFGFDAVVEPESQVPMSTMSDVARRAGVSLSTVSYVLSGKRAISEATRVRVQSAIDELDFHPNQLGRALASQRSHTIALLFPALKRGIG